MTEVNIWSSPLQSFKRYWRQYEDVFQASGHTNTIESGLDVHLAKG